MTATNAIGQTYNYRQFVYTKNTQYTFIFMLFTWFWTVTHIPSIQAITYPFTTINHNTTGQNVPCTLLTNIPMNNTTLTLGIGGICDSNRTAYHSLSGSWLVFH